MSTTKHLFVVLGASVLFTTRVAHADNADTSELEALLNENVVTTASKTSEVGTTAPATITTVTAEDLRRYGIRTLSEAIDFLSLGAVTSDSQHNVDVGARGVLIPNDSGDHMLLLVNGHTQNEPLLGRALYGRGAAVPMEMVDHIEVILGPGSVLYGSNAMLGVINVVTKRVKDWSGGHAVAEVEPGKSWRGLLGAGLTFPTPFAKAPAELTMGVEYYKHDGPTFLYDYRYGGVDSASARPVRYSRTGAENGYWGGLAKEAYYTRLPSGYLRLSVGNVELNVHASSFDRAAPYSSRYTKQFQDFDDPDSHERDRRVGIDLIHRARVSSVVRFTSRAYVDGWDWVNDIVSSGKSVCWGGGDLSVDACTFAARGRSRWAGLEVRADLDWLQTERLVTTLGVDGRVREMKAKIDFFETATGRALQSSQGVIDRTDTLIGPYLQQTILPTRWLSLNFGARLDKETRFDGVVSPRFAAAVRTWQGGTIKGSYAEAFRSPSYVETDYKSDAQVTSGMLTPERVRSVEGSFEQKFGAQRLLFGVFRSWWKDIVENHRLTVAEQNAAVIRGDFEIMNPGIGQFRNVSEIDNWGLNATFEGTAGRDRQFNYGLNITSAIARRNEAGKVQLPLVVAPQVFGNARVAYDIPGDWPTVAIAAHYLSKRLTDRAYDQNPTSGIYAPPQLEMRATVSGSIPFVRGLTYRLTATWSMASRGAYVVGPDELYGGSDRSLQLLPLDRLRAGIGLQYDFF